MLSELAVFHWKVFLYVQVIFICIVGKEYESSGYSLRVYRYDYILELAGEPDFECSTGFSPPNAHVHDFQPGKYQSSYVQQLYISS